MADSEKREGRIENGGKDLGEEEGHTGHEHIPISSDFHPTRVGAHVGHES